MIKVLWIDDQWRTEGEQFILYAEQYHIEIIPFDNSSEGIDCLTENIDDFHAVILDAKVKEDRESRDLNMVGLRKARDRINAINETHYLPYFIFTGQPDYMSSEMFKDSYGDFYVKGEDDKSLLEALITKVDKHPEMQARIEYPKAFACLDKGILINRAKALLISMLSNLRMQDYRKANLNEQRELLEAIFKSLNDPVPCIPKDLFQPDGRPILARCLRFMEDRPTDGHQVKGHKLNKNVPHNIKAIFKKLKHSTSQYSHLSDDAELRIPFLANAFLLLELLEWLPEFVEENYSNYI